VSADSDPNPSLYSTPMNTAELPHPLPSTAAQPAEHTHGQQGHSHPQEHLPPTFPITHPTSAQHTAADAEPEPSLHSLFTLGTYLHGQDPQCPYTGQVSRSFDSPSETPDASAGLGTRSITPQRSTHFTGPSSLVLTASEPNLQSVPARKQMSPAAERSQPQTAGQHTSRPARAAAAGAQVESDARSSAQLHPWGPPAHMAGAAAGCSKSSDTPSASPFTTAQSAGPTAGATAASQPRRMPRPRRQALMLEPTAEQAALLERFASEPKMPPHTQDQQVCASCIMMLLAMMHDVSASCIMQQGVAVIRCP
jgi:hypothetical protein